ncbi:hypothetical protein GCK32_020495, partial [Trichostrongylus colubriformis]
MALNLISSYGSEDDSDAADVDRSVHDSDVELPQPSEPTKNFFFGEADGSGSDDDSMGPSKNVDNTQTKPSGEVRRLPSAGSVLKGKYVVRAFTFSHCHDSFACSACDVIAYC